MIDIELSQADTLSLILKLLERPKIIAFNNAFWDICQDVNHALFLSQLFYWSKIKSFDWMYKSLSEWEEETHLSRYYIEEARKFLKKEGILLEKKKGVPCTVHYKIDLNGLLRALIKKNPQIAKNSQTRLRKIDKLDCESVANQFENSSQSIYTENTTEITTENTNISTSNEVVLPAVKIPFEEIVEIYHEKLSMLPQVVALTEKRKALIKTLWTKHKKAQDLEWWHTYFDWVKQSPFLLGESKRGWRADFEFLVNYNNMLKVVEGKYHGEN